MAEFRRKLYRRGSSYETTIPMPLLFEIEKRKNYDVVFKFDTKSRRWYLIIEERNTEHTIRGLKSEYK